jgi:predicted dienelactone hydrolase
MRSLSLFVTILLCLAATLAHAAGVQFIVISPDADNGALSGAVWSPCASPPQEVKLYSVVTPGVLNCPVQGTKLPLIVISHGQDGWFGGHHDTAEALADAGFIVAAINHPGDNAVSATRTRDISIAARRPVDIKRLIDFMLGPWSDSAKIDAQRVGFFGHSRGGYTGLVLAGADPDFKRAAADCGEAANASANSPCALFKGDAKLPDAPLTHDARIKALLLADPGFAFLLGADELKPVTLPVQLWSSELGGAGATAQSVAQIMRWLPAKPDFHLVAHADDWAFTAPCTAEQAKSLPRICNDTPSFDRIAFHREFNAAVVAFFRAQLKAP